MLERIDLLGERVDNALAKVIGFPGAVDELEVLGNVDHVILEAEVHDDLNEARTLALCPVVELGHLGLGFTHRELTTAVEVVEGHLGNIDGEAKGGVMLLEMGDGIVGTDVIPMKSLPGELATFALAHEVLHPVISLVAGSDGRSEDGSTLLAQRVEGLPVNINDFIWGHARGEARVIIKFRLITPKGEFGVALVGGRDERIDGVGTPDHGDELEAVVAWAVVAPVVDQGGLALLVVLEFVITKRERVTQLRKFALVGVVSSGSTGVAAFVIAATVAVAVAAVTTLRGGLGLGSGSSGHRVTGLAALSIGALALSNAVVRADNVAAVSTLDGDSADRGRTSDKSERKERRERHKVEKLGHFVS